VNVADFRVLLAGGAKRFGARQGEQASQTHKERSSDSHTRSMQRIEQACHQKDVKRSGWRGIVLG
jgi:hypothetical protein